MQNWLLFNVYFPLGAPLLLGLVINAFSRRNVKVFSFLRDGSLLMFCLLSAFEFLNDIGEMQAAVLARYAFGELSGLNPIDIQTYKFATIACAVIIAASAAVYGNNIRVDESRIRRGQVKETTGAIATLALTLLFIIYYRQKLGAF